MTPTMENGTTFKINQLFKSVTYYEDSNSWFFLFTGNTNVTSSGFWRILKESKIEIASFDHRHQFGLPRPLNLIEKVTHLLTSKTLIEINVNKDTADLILLISDNITIEIFITSTGYESYEFSIDDKRFIGMGGGELGVVEQTANPNIFNTRKM